MSMYLDVALLPFYVSEAVSYLAMGGVGYLSWRLVRAYERRGLELDRLDSLARRLEYLEVAVEQAAEAQRFTTALLAGRPPAGTEAEVGHPITSLGNATFGNRTFEGGLRARAPTP